MLRLRLRGPGGTATGSFDGAASIEAFLAAASEQLGCAGAKLDMLVGFPPKQCEISGAPLSSVVGSGDTVVLNVIAAAPDSAADSSSHSDRPAANTPATAGPSVAAALAPAPPSDQHRRPRQGDTHTADANKRQAGPSRSGGPVIYVGGACKDSAGHHALRPAAVPSSTVEVDCRKSGTEVRQQGNVATLASGLGSLHDRKPASDAERERVLEFLKRDAREISKSLQRGESVWVHCAQGFNRGPSGLLAYLLLYTDASWEEACDLVKAARPRARTRHNTFREQLEQIARGPKGFADHTSLDIRDGGNDPCDDKR